jgi:hypothetical protein
MPAPFERRPGVVTVHAMKHVGRSLLCGLLMTSVAGTSLLGSGCASSVANGTMIGAGAGLAAGAGVGYALADDKLLGSSNDPQHGDTSLPKGETILASIAVGVAVGAVIGAMVGHQREQKYVRRKPAPPPPPGGEQAKTTDPIIGSF